MKFEYEADIRDADILVLNSMYETLFLRLLNAVGDFRRSGFLRIWPEFGSSVVLAYHNGVMGDDLLSHSPSREQGGGPKYSRTLRRDTSVKALGTSTEEIRSSLLCGDFNGLYTYWSPLLYATTKLCTCPWSLYSTSAYVWFEPTPAQPISRVGALDRVLINSGRHQPRTCFLLSVLVLHYPLCLVLKKIPTPHHFTNKLSIKWAGQLNTA